MIALPAWRARRPRPRILASRYSCVAAARWRILDRWSRLRFPSPDQFVRHSLHRTLRSVKYRNSFLCLRCLVTMTLENLHPGWRPSEITRALDRIYAAPGIPMESRAAFRCAHCRNVKPCLGSPYL